MMKQQITAWGAACVALLMTGGLAGCGGSDGVQTPVASPTPAPSVNITRGTESTFSQSARILAAREAARNGATWLSAETARLADVDLAAIRRAYPQVATIEARPEYDLRTVLVAIPPTAPFLQNWLRGETATGDAGIDALLTEFAPESVESVGSPIEGGTYYFTLKFGQSLNMVKLAERLRAASAVIVAADPNRFAGDGDDIVRDDAAGKKRYIWSRGSGDCPAGCINRYSYTFEIAADGTVILVREGEEIPGGTP
ncbi:MAG: hypothetical protein H7Y38_06540 [Armatimonadetes bacterium]|nr:hypothetical protein [Armatimonadota bacterium]